MKIAKTTAVLLSFLFSLPTISSAQFMHAVGGGVNIMSHKVEVMTSGYPLTYEKKTESLFHASTDYFPRYNISESENSSVSVGMPVGLGFGIANDQYGNSSAPYFSGDISAGMYYNSGAKSTRENTSGFGYFVGGGFSYGYVGIYYEGADFKANTYGPMLHTGLRFRIAKGIMNAGLFGRLGLEKEKFMSYGLKIYAEL